MNQHLLDELEKRAAAADFGPLALGLEYDEDGFEYADSLVLEGPVEYREIMEVPRPLLDFLQILYMSSPELIASFRATAASPNEVTPLDTLEPLTKDELEAAAFGLAMRTERVGFPSFTQYAYELASRAVQQLRAAASVTGSREGLSQLVDNALECLAEIRQEEGNAGIGLAVRCDQVEETIRALAAAPVVESRPDRAELLARLAKAEKLLLDEGLATPAAPGPARPFREPVGYEPDAASEAAAAYRELGFATPAAPLAPKAS